MGCRPPRDNQNVPIDDWIDTWRDPLTALAAGWGAGWAEAAEIAQDALVEGYLGRERLRGDPLDRSVSGPWLRGIARRLFLARQRRGARARPLDAVPAEPFEDDSTTTEDPRLAHLRRAIAALPETLRTAVHLRYLDDTTNADVAEQLGISERAVEGRLRRARQQLAEAMEMETTDEHSA